MTQQTDDLIFEAKRHWVELRKIAIKLKKLEISLSLVEHFDKTSTEYFIPNVSERLKVEYKA